MEIYETIARELAQLIPADRLTYQKGILTVHPESAAETAATVKAANKHRWRLFISGHSNTIKAPELESEIAPESESNDRLIVLKSDRLGELRSIDESGLSVIIEPGFPLGELNRKLEPAGLFFPLAELAKTGSVGGAIAVGLCAGLDLQRWSEKIGSDGAPLKPFIDMARYLLELEVVTPAGEIKLYGKTNAASGASIASARALSPSWGALGFIASAKLRVLPESAREEYSALTQREVSPAVFLGELADSQSYLSRIKAKLDPNGVLVVVSETK